MWIYSLSQNTKHVCLPRASDFCRLLNTFVNGLDRIIRHTYSVPERLFWKKSNKGAKIRKRYNQVPHLTQDTNGKVTNSQQDTINESQEVSPFPAGDHKAHINRRAQRHSNHKTEWKQKKIHKRFWTVSSWFWKKSADDNHSMKNYPVCRE